jgi:hypothetical protein
MTAATSDSGQSATAEKEPNLKSVEGQIKAEGSVKQGPAITRGAAIKSSAEASTNHKVAAITAQSPGSILEQLGSVPATQAYEAYTEAQGASTSALEQQKQTVEHGMPVVPTPTGLPARWSKMSREKRSDGTSVQALGTAPEKSGREKEQYSTAVEPLPAAAPLMPVRISAPEVKDDQAAEAELASEAQASLDGVDVDVPPVALSAGERPSVDVTGEADPGQMDGAEEHSNQQMLAAKAHAAGQVNQDFGENEIFPEPAAGHLKSKKTFSVRRTTLGKRKEAGELPSEAVAGVNMGLGPVLAERVGEKKKEYDLEEAKFDRDQSQAHRDAEAEIARLDSETRKTQLQEQGDARKDVAGSRESWRGEIDNVEKDYKKSATTAAKEKREEIDTEKKKGEREANKQLHEAEQKAAEEKRKSEEQARLEKEKARKESSGFWGWVKSAASALIDGLKKAFNFIYDNLRKAVKAIFEAAKKLALAAIEFARRAIVLAIKGFGLLLKGFVSVAFAAFPGIRSRILAKIDKTVNTAVHLVNKAAAALKSAVTAVLDFLANTLDKILGLIQSIYNGIFTIVGMLIRGEFQEIIRRIGYLVDAAKTVPDQFETAALEELLGGNLDEPLSPMELMQAGIAPPGAHVEGSQPPEKADNSELPVAPWSEKNVGVEEVEPNLQLSPELATDVTQRTGGSGEVELAASAEESRTMAAVMAEVSPTGAAKGEEREEPKFPDDGLTPEKRAEIKWKAMKEGISKWWSDNWPKVLLGAAGALVAFIALNIVTGGAITAALPVILEIVGPLFLGQTILMLAERLKDYLELGWNGQIRPAGKSLAKGLAAGAIELISYLTFKAGGLAMKGAKALAKGAKAVATAGLDLAKAGIALLKRGAKFLISKAKVLFEGIAHSGIGKAFSRLTEMGEELLKRLRFRKFRIRLSGARFVLEGFINPWVIIAEGEITVVKKGTAEAKFVTNEEMDALKSGGKLKGGDLDPGEVGSYKDLTKKGVKGDRLTPDHIPSRAALVRNEELKRIAQAEEELGRELTPAEARKLKLTDAEIRKINEEGITIGTEHDIHTAGRTYGGKNQPAQIALDAMDLGKAYARDAEAILEVLKAEGKLTPELVGSYLRAYRANVMKGVFKYSAEIDKMFMNFL